MQVEYKYNFIFNPKSNRLEDFEYSGEWAYFITICCKDRQKYFWEILDSEMILNEYGRIVEEDLKNLEKYYGNIIVDEFVIMPNHIHFILFIKGTKKDVSEKHLYNEEEIINFSKEYYSNISPKRWELGSIIKSFKWYASKKLNKLNDKIFFAWQKNYYDRIIRDEFELQKIRNYIKINPKKWNLEKDNTEWIFM